MGDRLGIHGAVDILLTFLGSDQFHLLYLISVLWEMESCDASLDFTRQMARSCRDRAGGGFSLFLLLETLLKSPVLSGA